ncbi:CBS domain-containing protein [Fervidicoccus fontis]|nr:CBS domain-containing protein [Fervidicoccus fontis]MBE9391796.1 CBS domain-containing protein [Fervidicoccus fontis]PMB76746.1 MAG: hypothetical protein C0177_05250 [Fervidicoccus fontis]HEW63819.1 CBS domain-containing protein [Fervidicoccus fontis]
MACDIKNLLNENVSFLLRTDFPTIDKNQTLTQAFKLMEKYRIDRVVVTENKIPIGIMTKKDVLNKLMVERTRLVSASRLHVSSFYTPNLYHVDERSTVADAGREMKEKKISSVAVMKDDALVGIVIRMDYSKLLSSCEEISSKSFASSLKKVVRFGERITSLREIFLKEDVVYLPVVDPNNYLAGYITVNNIADALLFYQKDTKESLRKVARKEIVVEEVMSRPPLFVYSSDPISKASKLIIEHQSRGVSVIEKDLLIGIIDDNDILRNII